jgi:hypothetical protein
VPVISCGARFCVPGQDALRLLGDINILFGEHLPFARDVFHASFTDSRGCAGALEVMPLK